MHPFIPFQYSFALLLLLFSLSTSTQPLAYDDCKSLIEQVDPPFDNNSSSLSKSYKTIESEITATKFTYLMKLCVETSGRYVATYAVPDTGSDFIWLNAKDCKGKGCHCSTSGYLGGACIKEEPEDMIKCTNVQDCGEEDLKKLNIQLKCENALCKYDEITYGDGSTTEGWLGIGNFKFLSIDDGKTEPQEVKLEFGVSTRSEGNREPESKGIVGLGFGALSLIQQYKRIQPKFSYCLPLPNSATKSKFRFGSNVQTYDKFTRLLSKTQTEDYCAKTKSGNVCVCELRYCVHLSSISIKEKKITVNEDNKVMVVDSGTTFTLLVNGLFNEFLEKVKDAIGHDHNPKEFKYYDNCFEEESAKKLEKLSFGFGVGESKLEVELKRENFFDRFTPDEGKSNYLCLTVGDGDKKNKFGIAKNYHILGSRAQMDFLVAFDLGKDKKVSFDDMQDCSKLHNGEFSALLISE